MYTQNTSVHVGLWHHDFWALSIANMLATAAAYLQIPLLPAWMTSELGLPPIYAASALAVSGIGAFSLGCFCSYLIQHYRRNKVCVLLLLAMGACALAFYYLHKYHSRMVELPVLILVLRFLHGAVFGLVQMVLSGALVIDKCKSAMRTEANHSSACLSRLAMACGLAMAVYLASSYGLDLAFAAGSVLCLLAASLVLLVKFPFKAPDDIVHKVSLDRFFLPKGKWLFVNLFAISLAVGVFLTLGSTPGFYCLFGLGIVMAMLAQKFVFVNADLKSEITTALILLSAAFLSLSFVNLPSASRIAPVFAGCGTGLAGARFLLFFLKLSDHCQRGTAQSTFFLSWESGISAGLFLGYGLFFDNGRAASVCAVAISALALAMYLRFTHKWYMANKNR